MHLECANKIGRKELETIFLKVGLSDYNWNWVKERKRLRGQLLLSPNICMVRYLLFYYEKPRFYAYMKNTQKAKKYSNHYQNESKLLWFQNRVNDVSINKILSH